MQSFEVTRLEYKYLLTLQQAAALGARLQRGMMPDKNNGPNGYRVKSLYFDTWDDGDYYEKEAGIKDRNKLRLRVYDESDEVAKLECKKKDGDYQRKLTIPVGRDVAGRLVEGDTGALLAMPDAKAVALYEQLSKRRPVGVVEYERKAYLWPSHNTRVTLDSCIRYAPRAGGLYERWLPYRSVLPEGSVILEVKYDLALEPFVRDLLVPYCGSRFSFGKYEQARRV